MTKHVIEGCFGENDFVDIQAEPDSVVTRINFLNNNGNLNNWLIKAFETMTEMAITPTPIGRDLLILAAQVYAADTRISRSSESQNNWTREIQLIVPVSDTSIWEQSLDNLTRMLNFLTGDRWQINFKSYPDDFDFPPIQLNLETQIEPFENVSLFSGGLDSLVGAIDQLEEGANNVFVSHASEGASSKAQEDCFTALANHYQDQLLRRVRIWLNFPKNLIPGVPAEESTRGRSFLFFALGACIGTSNPDHFTLLVPENGLISLNVPLDPLRLGSLSTKTTHPFFIKCWNTLLQTLGIQGRIENPYWNKTKGEMLENCANQTLLRQIIANSMSCSSFTKSRWIGHSAEHCGYCVPCVIRRAAILQALGEGNDPTVYTVPNLADRALNSKSAEGVQIRSFQLALRRIRRNPNLARFLIFKPGPLDGDNEYIDELENVYIRGMEEVGELLAEVETRPL